MNKTIVIVGGSAGADISGEIFSKQYEKILYLETYSKRIEKNLIIANKITDGLDYLKDKSYDYFIATGDNMLRKKNFDLINKSTNKNPINCIHSSAIISESSKLGFGNLICPGAIVHTNAVIGNNTIINTGSIIEHDCKVGDYAQVSPNTTLCGYVEIGEGVFVGAGSTIIPKVKIGKNCIIAAGSSVIDNTEEYKMYAGVPAIFKKKI